MVEPDGTVLDQQFDAAGLLIRRDVAPGSGVAPDATFEEYRRDGLGRVREATNDAVTVSRDVDSLGRVSAERVGSLEVSVLRDELGNVLEIRRPGRTLTLIPDVGPSGPLARIREIRDDAGLIVRADRVGDRLQRLHRGNGVVTSVGHDALGRVQEMSSVDAGGSLVLHLALDHDVVGNVVSEHEMVLGGDVTWDHDSFDRMVASHRRPFAGVDPSTTTYAHDGAQNRTTVTRDGASCDHVLSDATVPPDRPVNQYSLTCQGKVTHDERGNVVGVRGELERTLTWDGLGRLVRIEDGDTGVSVHHVHDAFGRRVETTRTAADGTQATRSYLFHGNNVVEVRDESGALVLEVDRSPGLDSLLGARSGTDSWWYVTDDQGSVRALLDDAGVVLERISYLDYGEPMRLVSSGLANPFHYMGRPWDEDFRLHDLRARWMDPETGRFLSRDPIGIWGDALNFGNGMAYAGNNPRSRIDPLGLQAAAGGAGRIVSEDAVTFDPELWARIEESVRRHRDESVAETSGARDVTSDHDPAEQDADVKAEAAMAFLMGEGGAWLQESLNDPRTGDAGFQRQVQVLRENGLGDHADRLERMREEGTATASSAFSLPVKVVERIGDLSVRAVIRGVGGGLKRLLQRAPGKVDDTIGAAKRGPKPFGQGPHNQKIKDVADSVTDGQVIAGGQTRLPERLIPTPGGVKSGRRPDVLVQRSDGSQYGINVGKQVSRTGAPIKREAEAINDLEGAGVEMHFVPYN